ncbi:MAG: thioredoxin family protein [Actinomycetes bacterium]
MQRLVIAAAVAAIAVGLSYLLRRKDHAAPTQPRTFAAPLQVDRQDFPRPDAEWLVMAFTSNTCGGCADVRSKVAALESDDVAVVDVEAGDQADLHARYGVEAVPIVAVADRSGVVQASFVGPVSATHLWGALAELRSPGSVPPGCGASGEHHHDDGPPA